MNVLDIALLAVAVLAALVAVAAAVVAVRSARRVRLTAEKLRTRSTPRPAPADDGGAGARLMRRLREFQAERFAPPMPGAERKRG